MSLFDPMFLLHRWCLGQMHEKCGVGRLHANDGALEKSNLGSGSMMSSRLSPEGSNLIQSGEETGRRQRLDIVFWKTHRLHPTSL